jgi:hypothetical protein
MVFNLTHSQVILRYKENGGRIEPYTIVIMAMFWPRRLNKMSKSQPPQQQQHMAVQKKGT